jgi:hypothetical protein
MAGKGKGHKGRGKDSMAKLFKDTPNLVTGKGPEMGSIGGGKLRKVGNQ